MSNGITSVFIEALSAAATELAETHGQRLMAAWLASHDQGIFGLGMVGFALSSLPWSPARLDAERSFLLRVIHTTPVQMG